MTCRHVISAPGVPQLRDDRVHRADLGALDDVQRGVFGPLAQQLVHPLEAGRAVEPGRVHQAARSGKMSSIRTVRFVAADKNRAIFCASSTRTPRAPDSFRLSALVDTPRARARSRCVTPAERRMSRSESVAIAQHLAYGINCLCVNFYISVTIAKMATVSLDRLNALLSEDTARGVAAQARHLRKPDQPLPPGRARSAAINALCDLSPLRRIGGLAVGFGRSTTIQER